MAADPTQVNGQPLSKPATSPAPPSPGPLHGSGTSPSSPEPPALQKMAPPDAPPRRNTRTHAAEHDRSENPECATESCAGKSSSDSAHGRHCPEDCGSRIQAQGPGESCSPPGASPSRSLERNNPASGG